MDSLNKLNTSNNIFNSLTEKQKIKRTKLAPLKESKIVNAQPKITLFIKKQSSESIEIVAQDL